jgi:hypothetical protein
MIRRRAASPVRLVVLMLNEEPDIRRCLGVGLEIGRLAAHKSVGDRVHVEIALAGRFRQHGFVVGLRDNVGTRGFATASRLDYAYFRRSLGHLAVSSRRPQDRLRVGRSLLLNVR